MCTALALASENKLVFFGRNMDIAGGFTPNPTIVPEGYSIKNTATGEDMVTKYTMLGMSMNIEGIPFFGDAMNDKGLGAAGLAFPGMVISDEKKEGCNNIPQYLFLEWVCGCFASVDEILPELRKLNMMSTPPFKGMNAAPMHWMIYDISGKSAVVEYTDKGLSVYDKTIGVMTNYPGYDWHMQHLMNYMNITPDMIPAQDWSGYEVTQMAPGIGTHGLPGGTNSQDRFVRVAWLKNVVPPTKGEKDTVGKFFHIMQNVAKPRGTSYIENNGDEHTAYTSCMCLTNGTLYYNTYANNQISRVSIKDADVSDGKMTVFELNDTLEPLPAKMKTAE